MVRVKTRKNFGTGLNPEKPLVRVLTRKNLGTGLNPEISWNIIVNVIFLIRGGAIWEQWIIDYILKS